MKHVWAVLIGDLEGELDVSGQPSCTLGLGRERYAIRVRRSTGGWGEPQFDCDVDSPDGHSAHSGASPRDGVGVSLEDGKDWSLDRAVDGAYLLGRDIRVERDDEAGTLRVTGPVPPNRIAHVIAGLVLIAHPDA